MAKAWQSFSSCSSHQSVLYFLWWYKNILTGVGSLNEKVRVHILLLEMYARPQKMNPLDFFFQLSVTEAAQNGKCPAFAQSSLTVYKQLPQGTWLFHECCKQEQRWERKKPKKCTSRTDTCMLEGGRDAWSPLAYIIIQTLNQKRIMLCIWVSTN